MSPRGQVQSGSRQIEVAPGRLAGWFDGFADRHGALDWSAGPTCVTVTAADGARAVCAVPAPPLVEPGSASYAGLVAHANAPRRIGLLLVRLGGHAAGVADGDLLIASKVGTRLVHGRSAAGGQSQQRFARRREGQARQSLAAAADLAVRVLLPAVGDFAELVLGGDRRALTNVLADARLAPLRPLVREQVLDVPQPRQVVLETAVRRARAVRIQLTDPDSGAGSDRG